MRTPDHSTKKRMETIDDEVPQKSGATSSSGNAKAGTPFFVWFNIDSHALPNAWQAREPGPGWTLAVRIPRHA